MEKAAERCLSWNRGQKVREVYVDSHFLFKRTAFVEDGVLKALAVEPLISEPLEGAIFLGRVTAIVESLDAAFVDLGLTQDAFLPLQDLPERLDRKHLKNGSELLVQLKVEGGRYKGPKVTGKIEILGRCLVLMPESRQKSVSRKLKDNTKREALMSLVDETVGELGYIVRTEGALTQPEVVAEEASRLKMVWDRLQRSYVTVRSPQCVDPGLSASQRLLLKHLSTPDTALVLSNPEDAPVLDAFFKDYSLQVDLASYIKGKKRNPFLFEQSHQLERQIQALLDKRVELNGAYLIIEPTEAFHAVDVNAGSAANGIRQTIGIKKKINQEAIVECLRQLELRNIGGMVMMDLIDAESETERQFYNAFLKKTLQSGYSSIFGAEVSSLGVLSLTRRRMGSALAELITETCSCCGQGRVLSAAAQLDRMLKEAVRSGERSPKFRVSSSLAKLIETLEPLISMVEKDFRLELRWEPDESLDNLSIRYKKTL